MELHPKPFLPLAHELSSKDESIIMPLLPSKGNTTQVAPIRSGASRATGTMIHKRGGKLTAGYPENTKRNRGYSQPLASKSVANQPGVAPNRKPADRLWGSG